MRYCLIVTLLVALSAPVLAQEPVGVVLTTEKANAVFNGECLSRKQLIPWDGSAIPDGHVALSLQFPADGLQVAGEIERALGMGKLTLIIGENEPIPAGYHFAGFSTPGKRFIQADLKPVVFCD